MLCRLPQNIDILYLLITAAHVNLGNIYIYIYIYIYICNWIMLSISLLPEVSNVFDKWENVIFTQKITKIISNIFHISIRKLSKIHGT